MAFRGDPDTLLGAVMLNTSYVVVVNDETAKRLVPPFAKAFSQPRGFSLAADAE
jgi:hypothetical protein